MAPTFAGVTEGLSASLRRQVAVRAALIAAAILVGAALIGNWLLQKLAISLSAFRIAGGLLLFSIATEMVFGVRMQREGEAAEQAVKERAYPAPRPRFRRQKPKMILTRALSLLRCEPADDFKRDGIQRERD